MSNAQLAGVHPNAAAPSMVLRVVPRMHNAPATRSNSRSSSQRTTCRTTCPTPYRSPGE